MRHSIDVSQTEEWMASTGAEERCRRDIALQHGDADTRPSPSDRELTSCPAIYREVHSCNFAASESRARPYHCQFPYQPTSSAGPA